MDGRPRPPERIGRSDFVGHGKKPARPTRAGGNYLRRFVRMYAIQAFVPGFGFRDRARDAPDARRLFPVREAVAERRRLRRRPELDLLPAPTATACAAV